MEVQARNRLPSRRTAKATLYKIQRGSMLILNKKQSAITEVNLSAWYLIDEFK